MKSRARGHPCPISSIARLLGKKWTLELLYFLRSTTRFCELQDVTNSVSPTTLARRLRELEKAGLLKRTVIPSFPPTVEYELSQMGEDLGPMIDLLASWSSRWLPEGTVGRSVTKRVEPLA